MDSEFYPRKRRPKKQRRRAWSRTRKRVSKMRRNARGQFVKSSKYRAKKRTTGRRKPVRRKKDKRRRTHGMRRHRQVS